MEAETNYIDAIKNYKENPIESLKVHAKNKGFEYGKRLGLSLEQTEEMIFNDFSKVK
jgi:hypothetical protein